MVPFFCLHAVANTPAGRMEFVRSYDSLRFGLPHNRGGSAPALVFSRPAQRSLTLRPACSPSRHSDPLHQRLQQSRCLHCCSDCYRVERTSSRAGLTPAVDHRLFTAHPVGRQSTQNLVFRVPESVYDLGGERWKEDKRGISLSSQSRHIFLFLDFSGPHDIGDWYLPDGHCGPASQAPSRRERSRCWSNLRTFSGRAAFERASNGMRPAASSHGMKLRLLVNHGGCVLPLDLIVLGF